MEMTLKGWLKMDARNENIIISGIRYSLNRNSYQKSDGCMVAASLLPYLTNRAIKVIFYDLCDDIAGYQFRKEQAGKIMDDEIDIPHVMKCLSEFLKEMKKRNIWGNNDRWKLEELGLDERRI